MSLQLLDEQKRFRERFSEQKPIGWKRKGGCIILYEKTPLVYNHLVPGSHGMYYDCENALGLDILPPKERVTQWQNPNEVFPNIQVLASLTNVASLAEEPQVLLRNRGIKKMMIIREPREKTTPEKTRSLLNLDNDWSVRHLNHRGQVHHDMMDVSYDVELWLDGKESL